VIKILIADDHAILRRGLRGFLGHELEGAYYGEADSSQQVLLQVQREHWDLLILDITMPGRSGLDVLGDIKKERPRLPVLVLSVHPEDQFAKRALRAGASGYMSKECPLEELIKAIRKVLAGGTYVSPTLAEKLALNFGKHSEEPPHERLSDREFEVLRMIASGRTISQIAEDLHLSASTVSTHRAHILEKTAMTTNAELVRYALENHLIY
jgi:DNA-binding NarL/FixJ family response regulator